MAAIVAAARARGLRLRLHNMQVASRRSKYIVLLPEIPEDTAETNPLLKAGGLPQYSHIDVDKCINAIGKLVINFEGGICRLEEKLKDGSEKKDFETVIKPIEQLSAPLGKAWSTLQNLYITKCSEKYNEAYIKLLPRIQKAKFERFQNLPIHHAMKEINADRDRLTEEQKRVVDKYLLEAKLDGIELTGYQLNHFQTNARKLQSKRDSYRRKIDAATRVFTHTIEDPNLIKDLPENIMSLMASDKNNPRRGPWTVTLNTFIYYPFMEYCESSLLRWNVWKAFNSRGSKLNKKLSCSVDMEEMRFIRNDQAHLLGYKTFADMSMETKMAGSVENVHSMITTIHTKSKTGTEKEISELQEFATKNGFTEQPQQWDISYWRRKQKEALFNIDEAQVRQYFPLPVVLEGLFRFTSELFGVTIKEMTGEVEVWNEDVKYYVIMDHSGNKIASFYLDPYIRLPDKLYGAWMIAGQSRSDYAAVQPFAYLIFSFPRPIVNRPSLLSFQDVTTLFEKFGHLLQHSLTSTPYSDVAGMNNLEWDVINVCPLFMTHWLYHYNTIASISGHVDGGNPLPEDLHKKLQMGHLHMKGFDLTQELYKSTLDLELHSRKEFWANIYRGVWSRFMPFPPVRDDFHVCSFREIFCDELPASYFSLLWSEMIAADLFSAFWEVGLDNKKEVREMGKRLRELFLSPGGGSYPSEAFRKFRGRDPSPVPLLKIYQVEESNTSKESSSHGQHQETN